MKNGGRFLSALLIFLAAACAPTQPPPTVEAPPFAIDAATETFAAGFSSITEKYIEPVMVGDLAIDGMRGLGSIDPALTVNRIGPDVLLASAETPIARFTAPAEDDVDGWAALTVDVSAAGSRASREMRTAGLERIYEAVFDGALSNLDIFSRYAGFEEAKKQRAKREGFGGIGIRFNAKNGVVRVVSVMEKTPAVRAGLKKNDLITHIDGIPTQGMQKREVVDSLRGPVKTVVVLTLSRPDVTDPLRFEIEREHIVPTSVTSYDRDGILFLKVTGFNRETARSMGAKLRAAHRRLGKALKGVVIDLRANPGGLLKQSIKMADLFLSQGRIVRTRGRHPDSIQFYEASGDDLAGGLPMAVLMDGKSASAAEIVAAALQDSGRAVVIGTTSFGKGTVQTVIRLPNDGEITLTWSRFVSPAGYVLHGLGVGGRHLLDPGQLGRDVERAGRVVERGDSRRIRTARSARLVSGATAQCETRGRRGAPAPQRPGPLCPGDRPVDLEHGGEELAPTLIIARSLGTPRIQGAGRRGIKAKKSGKHGSRHRCPGGRACSRRVTPSGGSSDGCPRSPRGRLGCMNHASFQALRDNCGERDRHSHSSSRPPIPRHCHGHRGGQSNSLQNCLRAPSACCPIGYRIRRNWRC